MKYSLANYILSVTFKDSAFSAVGDVTLGGEGSATDSISIKVTNDLWSTTGFSTGGWVHNKNLSRVGTATISISQLSDKVAKFKQIMNIYYTGDYDGCTLSLVDNTGAEVATCNDCYITQIPEQAFGSSAGNQSWEFTCGEITFA